MVAPRKRIQLLLLLFAVFSTHLIAQNDSVIKKLLNGVRDASYYDSLKVFKAGAEVLKAGKNFNQHELLSELNIYYGNHLFYTIKYEPAKHYYELALKEAELAKSSHLSVLARITSYIH